VSYFLLFTVATRDLTLKRARDVDNW